MSEHLTSLSITDNSLGKKFEEELKKLDTGDEVSRKIQRLRRNQAWVNVIKRYVAGLEYGAGICIEDNPEVIKDGNMGMALVFGDIERMKADCFI